MVTPLPGMLPRTGDFDGNLRIINANGTLGKGAEKFQVRKKG